MKKSWLVQLALGLFLGMLLTVPLATSAPIQSQVGINVAAAIVPGGQTWSSVCAPFTTGDGVGMIAQGAPCTMLDVQAVQYLWNGNADPAFAGFNRARDATIGDGAAATGIAAFTPFLLNGTTFDRPRHASSDGLATGIEASGQMVFNATGAVWERARAADTASSTFTVGVPVAGLHGWGGSNWQRIATTAVGDNNATNSLLGVHAFLLDGTNFDRPRSASGTTLTSTTSLGVQLTTPLSTWSVTNTPATATQATASRAAGAAGVRHVATSITVCIATGATAQTPILSHLRDGASGAGTIIRSWSHAAPVNSKSCDNLSGLAMIGTAATAMTIEFTGAGVAASQQTVTLTGYSVDP